MRVLLPRIGGLRVETFAGSILYSRTYLRRYVALLMCVELMLWSDACSFSAAQQVN